MFYPVVLVPRLLQGLVYDSRLWNFVEGIILEHEVASFFAGFSDLYLYITEEIFSVPYHNDHGCFQVYPGQEELHDKAWFELGGYHVLVVETDMVVPEG